MKRKITILITAVICMVMMASCGGGLSIPDDYNYDDLSKYIKLGEYKGLEYEKEDRTITRHQIEAEIDEALENAAESVQVKEGTVKEDSVVNIDYSGSLNGEKFDGGTDEGYDLDIANSTFIDGFAEALVGHKVGENFDINVTFPEDYQTEDLAGQPAVFNITVNYMTEKQIPEYNDEFVQKNTGYKTTEEYEKSIEESLQADRDSEATASERGKVFDQIMDSTEVLEYPEAELKERKEFLSGNYKTAAEQYGMELGDYIQQGLGLDEDAFNDMVDEAAKNTVKTEMVAYQIARLEGIEISKEDYQTYIDELLKSAGITAEEFEEKGGMSIEEYAEQNTLFSSLVYQKVMDKVMEYCK